MKIERKCVGTYPVSPERKFMCKEIGSFRGCRCYIFRDCSSSCLLWIYEIFCCLQKNAIRHEVLRAIVDHIYN